jgi:uncharacterized protein (DUF1800 family)
MTMTELAEPDAMTDATITDMQAARFLLRAQFSALPEAIEAVQSLGYHGWLEQQFATGRGQRGFDWLDEQGHDAVTEEGRYFWPQAGDFMIWNQMLAQPGEMRLRTAYALSQFFVISLDPIDGFWPPYIMAAWWDMLADGAFGNFRDLLEGVTLNPGMGMYLNTKGNLKADPKTGRQPDENYAREIMQLFTIGLLELNPDGTPKLDATGQPIETYRQEDVTNLSRVFTGYDHDFSRVERQRVGWLNYPVPSSEFTRDPMAVDPDNHSTEQVDFLGLTIPADTPPDLQLKLALDHLFEHPNVGPFFGFQMIQRLVTSNPSPAYVARVAAAFDDNGEGVRGDLKAVWRAVLTDEEALAPADPVDPLHGKLREPVLRFVSWARTVGTSSETGAYRIFNTSRADEGLGQSPLRSPSVFNFFRPGYVPPQTAMARSGKVSPEFQITNETSLAGYINFLQWTLRGGYADVKPSYEVLMPLAHDPAELVTWLNLHLAANQVSSESCALIEHALAARPLTQDAPREEKLNTLASACLMVLSSPEYLVQT